MDRTRVALGRLCAALMVFRAATETPVMLELAGDLHAFGHVLGLVWVWDVFLDETWARIAQAFSGEKAIQAALPAALCGRERYRACWGAPLPRPPRNATSMLRARRLRSAPRRHSLQYAAEANLGNEPRVRRRPKVNATPHANGGAASSMRARA